MAEGSTLLIHTDGASRGNPGAAAYGYTIEHEGVVVAEEGDCLGQMTNNQAEYTALIRAVEHALLLGTEHELEIRSDSELMVKQLQGAYKVKNADLKPLYEELVQLLGKFTQTNIQHVKRAQNKRADELCNEALDGKRKCSIDRSTMQSLALKDSSVGNKPKRKKATLDDDLLKFFQESISDNSSSPESMVKEMKSILKRHGIEVTKGTT